MKKIFLSRPNIDSNEIISTKKVLNSGFLTEGKVTQNFENIVAKYVKAKHAIATSSGTAALHCAFESLNISGKKILVSDFTFPATVLAIEQAGGIPILADVEKESMNISRSIVENSLNKDTEIICPVSLFGNSLENDFYRLQKKNVVIVEDAATNLGTKLGTKYVGNLADITCFSFHPRKIITTGEGGMVTTNKTKIMEKIRSFKFFGKKNSNFENHGINYKISDILSSIGIEQMKKIEQLIKKRIELAKEYNELLSKIDGIESQIPSKDSRHTYQSFVCYLTKPNIRTKLIRNLKQNGIESQIGTYAIHCLPKFKNCNRLTSLSNSEFLYQNSISLPMHGELSSNDVTLICKIIKNSI
jgi:perosamine synthetase